jgi:hypothetical protein
VRLQRKDSGGSHQPQPEIGKLKKQQEPILQKFFASFSRFQIKLRPRNLR